MTLRTFIIFLSFFSICAVSRAFCDDGSDWFRMQGTYFTVEYQRHVDLETVSDKLDKRGILSASHLNAKSSSVTSPETKVMQRLERLFKKAEEILGMYPKNLKLTIKIFENSSSLRDEYFKIFAASSGYEAFYIYKYATIYTSESGISDSVMIHEMAHAIIDNYFSANPPEKVGEILAAYVDMHLTD